MIIAKHFSEGVTATLRPFRIMVASHNVVLVLQRVQHGFNRLDLLICTEIRHVAANQDKIEVR